MRKRLASGGTGNGLLGLETPWNNDNIKEAKVSEGNLGEKPGSKNGKRVNGCPPGYNDIEKTNNAGMPSSRWSNQSKRRPGMMPKTQAPVITSQHL